MLIWVLIVIFYLMLVAYLFLNKGKSYCPNCAKKIPFRERLKYVNQFTLAPRIQPCIHCGVLIRYKDLPLHLIRIFTILLLGFLITDIYLRGNHHQLFQFLILTLMISLITTLFFLRLKVVKNT